MKKTAQRILLAFVSVALGYWAWGKLAEPGAVPVPAVAADASREAKPVVVVTYFTTNVRCDSCRTIESLTRATVEEFFGAELAAGTVRFRTVNLDELANKHFAVDYDLSFKTVVVSEEASGEVLRWEKLDDVWSLLNQPEGFKAYVAAPVHTYLEPQT